MHYCVNFFSFFTTKKETKKVAKKQSSAVFLRPTHPGFKSGAQLRLSIARLRITDQHFYR